jgi:hypothetical protein
MCRWLLTCADDTRPFLEESLLNRVCSKLLDGRETTIEGEGGKLTYSEEWPFLIRVWSCVEGTVEEIEVMKSLDVC